MFLGDGVSERDLRGWKFGSDPLLGHPAAVVSILGSTITSSGSGGAPGSPGLKRLEEVVEEVVEEAAAMLAAAAGSPSFCIEGRLSEPCMSEVEGLRSPSGWKSRVELLEKELGRSVVVLGVLREQPDEELEAAAAEIVKEKTKMSMLSGRFRQQKDRRVAY